MNKIIRYIKYLLIFLLAIVTGLKGYQLIILGLQNSTTNEVNYTVSPGIEYKVYLKENNFFEGNFLGMNKTYISSLIDYIDVTYNYNIEFDKKMKGNYTYYIKGTISADKEDEDGNYWEKEFIIKNQEIVSFEDENKIKFNTNVKIDYQKYNDMLKEFKSIYGINFDGVFKVELIVTSLCGSDELSSPFTIETSPSLTIPLTEKTIDLSINTDNDAETKHYEEVVKSESTHDYIKIIIGAVLEIVTVSLLVTLFVLVVLKKPKKSLYNKTLSKILSAYDGIIVNIKDKPNFDGQNVVNVEKFSELIDAHNEVRLPINYYKEEGKSIFSLKNDDMVWLYTLCDENANIKDVNKISIMYNNEDINDKEEIL